MKTKLRNHLQSKTTIAPKILTTVSPYSVLTHITLLPVVNLSWFIANDHPRWWRPTGSGSKAAVSRGHAKVSLTNSPYGVLRMVF
jgi:hypothetical protein